VSRLWNPGFFLFLLLVLAACGEDSAGTMGSADGTAVMPPTPTLAATAPLAASPSPTTATTTSIQTAGDGNADVLFVRAVETDAGVWTFHVTVAHPDTGWEDYADGWDVLLPDGTILLVDPQDPFTRLLLHPHENEQPFTRSQNGLEIPPGTASVTVRAHDLVDGFGGQEVVVDLGQTAEMELYSVTRYAD